MLRIAVIGAAAEEVRSAALRLPGALVEPCDDLVASESLRSAESVAFAGATADPETVARVLGSRKHVLLATAIGLPLEQLDRLSEIAHEKGVVLSIVNPDCALASRRLIRQQIDNGKLGDVGLIRVSRCEPATMTGRTSDRLPPTLVNDIDLAIWLVGRAPDTVYAVQQDGDNPGERCRQVHLGFPGGGMALVTHTSIWPSKDTHQSVSVIASSGAAYADDHQNRQLLYGDGAVTAPAANEGLVLTTLLSDFVNAVQSAGSQIDCCQSWRQLATVVAAVEQSIASHDAVPVECR